MGTVQNHVARLAQEIQNVPAVLIFKADEFIFQEFMDASEMRIIDPASYPHDSIEIPASRSMKWSAMLVVVSADGSYLKPIIMIQRKTYEVDLLETGFTPANVLIVHCDCDFIDRNLFQLWAEKGLFPEIERRPVEHG
jgi:hypothetical protein